MLRFPLAANKVLTAIAHCHYKSVSRISLCRSLAATKWTNQASDRSAIPQSWCSFLSNKFETRFWNSFQNASSVLKLLNLYSIYLATLTLWSWTKILSTASNLNFIVYRYSIIQNHNSVSDVKLHSTLPAQQPTSSPTQESPSPTRSPTREPVEPTSPELHSVVRTKNLYIDRRTVSAFAQVRDAAGSPNVGSGVHLITVTEN